ncbi:Imm32 family immunity protein [Lysobacter enzymogenes]|nr:hypothetical protein [Lysobacter enzymogenes]
MKICGYRESHRSDQDVRPEWMEEITLLATPAELRRIAAFLAAAADEMDRVGPDYGHEHLCDNQPGFDDSPQLVVVNAAPPAP